MAGERRRRTWLASLALTFACGTFELGDAPRSDDAADGGGGAPEDSEPRPSLDSSSSAAIEAGADADADADTATSDADPPIEPCTLADLQNASFLQSAIAHGWVVSPTYHPGPLGIVAQPNDPLPVAHCRVSDGAWVLATGLRIEMDVSVNAAPSADTRILRVGDAADVGVATLLLSNYNTVYLELPGRSPHYCGDLDNGHKIFLSLRQDEDEIERCCTVTDDDDASDDCDSDRMGGNGAPALPQTVDDFEFGFLDAHNGATTTTSRVAVGAIPD